MEKLPAGLAEEAMSSASIQSHKICKNGHPSIVCFIDSFYFMLESLLHPSIPSLSILTTHLIP